MRSRKSVAGTGASPVGKAIMTKELSFGVKVDGIGAGRRLSRALVALAVLVLAGARETARLVRALREVGFEGRLVGGAPAGRRPFLEEAGASAGGVFFPLLFDVEDPAAARFASLHRERYGVPPDYLAAYAYDATRLLIAAIRRAGPNRALIRDALVDLAPWPGVTGPVVWDLTGRNTQPVGLGVWRGGQARRALDKD